MENEKESFPTFFDQIKNLSKSAKGVVSDIASGNKILVTDEIKEERLKICLTCDKNDAGRCRACGCYLEMKTKFASSYCPIMKWGSVQL
jgi:hypothetical protein